MPFISPAIGPIAGGYLTQHMTWRWVFWMTSIFDVAVQILASADPANQVAASSGSGVTSAAIYA